MRKGRPEGRPVCPKRITRRSRHPRNRVIFFDRKIASEKPWTKKVWIYDFRTNEHFTQGAPEIALLYSSFHPYLIFIPFLWIMSLP
jgi:hypothetical protein